MPRIHLVRRLIAAALLLAVQVAGADEVDRSRAELEAVRDRIEALRREISVAEAGRDSISDALEEAGRKLAASVRELRRQELSRRALEEESSALEHESAALNERIASRRTRFAQWLVRHYRTGHDARLADFFVSRDPNQLARDGYYVQKIGQANLGVIQQQRADISRIAEISARMAVLRNDVAELEAKQREEVAQQVTARKAYRSQLAEVDARLKGQQRQVDALALDERRLGRLIVGLEKLARERAAKHLAGERSGPAATRQEPRRDGDGQLAREPVVATIGRQVSSAPAGVPFERLKGRLDPPLAGVLVGRFGAPRADGGPAWKGVFIRADEGQSVRAVASGEVVFAEWLRGFGNLMIVDHGDGYLTIYGNNESVLFRVGDRVAGGDPIASVGAGGSSQESGLYFEIRHRGEPLDPMGWVRFR